MKKKIIKESIFTAKTRRGGGYKENAIIITIPKNFREDFNIESGKKYKFKVLEEVK